MSDIGKFYIDDEQSLVEILAFGERYVELRNYTKKRMVKIDKVMWAIMSDSFEEVGGKQLKLAKLLYT